MSAYIAGELELCRMNNHRFKVVGSDKTPMKRSLMCVTCTDKNPGKSVYVAYANEQGANWGQWRSQKRDDANNADDFSAIA